MTRRTKIVMASILAAVVAGIALPGVIARDPLPAAPAAGEEELPWVRVSEVASSTESLPVHATGFLSRRVESALAFHRGGILAEITVRPGDAVKRGQVLARLRLDEIEADLAQATIQVEKCRRDLARSGRLHQENAISLEILQNSETSLALAEARLRIAEFGRRHAEIIAPDDGAILARQAEPDEWIEAGRAVVEFGSAASGWIVKASLAEHEVKCLRVGDTAEFEGITGKILRIPDAADPATRTVEIEVECDGPPPDARSRRTVDLVLKPRPVAARPVVPASALLSGEGDRGRIFLWDQDTGVARGVEVTVTGILGTMAFLNAEPSLDHGWVVTTGAEYLRDGTKARRAAQP